MPHSVLTTAPLNTLHQLATPSPDHSTYTADHSNSNLSTFILQSQRAWITEGACSSNRVCCNFSIESTIWELQSKLEVWSSPCRQPLEFLKLQVGGIVHRPDRHNKPRSWIICIRLVNLRHSSLIFYESGSLCITLKYMTSRLTLLLPWFALTTKNKGCLSQRQTKLLSDVDDELLRTQGCRTPNH